MIGKKKQDKLATAAEVTPPFEAEAVPVQVAQITPSLSPGLRYVKRTGPAVPAAKVLGPSPNPATNLAIADIALRTGSLIARQAVERALLGRAYAPSKARRILRGRSMAQILLHRSIAKLAMGSIPGALVVGGSLLAKTLYERRQEHKAAAKGAGTLEQMAQDGGES